MSRQAMTCSCRRYLSFLLNTSDSQQRLLYISCTQSLRLPIAFPVPPVPRRGHPVCPLLSVHSHYVGRCEGQRVVGLQEEAEERVGSGLCCVGWDTAHRGVLGGPCVRCSC